MSDECKPGCPKCSNCGGYRQCGKWYSNGIEKVKPLKIIFNGFTFASKNAAIVIADLTASPEEGKHE